MNGGFTSRRSLFATASRIALRNSAASLRSSAAVSFSPRSSSTAAMSRRPRQQAAFELSE